MNCIEGVHNDSVGAAKDVAKERQAALNSAGITFLKIAKEFATIAFSDIKDYVEISPGGELSAIPLDEIKPKKATKAIKKIKENTKITESKDGQEIFKDSRIEYELYDKVECLKYLTKLLEMEPAQQTDLNLSGKVDYTDTELAMRLNRLIEQVSK